LLKDLYKLNFFCKIHAIISTRALAGHDFWRVIHTEMLQEIGFVILTLK